MSQSTDPYPEAQAGLTSNAVPSGDRPPDPPPRPGPAPHREAKAPPTPLWPDGDVASFESRWRDVQLAFVDDPHHATDQAGALVGEALDRLNQVVSGRRSEVDAGLGVEDASTDQMLIAVRQYRGLLDQILAIDRRSRPPDAA